MILEKNGRKHSVISLLSLLPELQHLQRIDDFFHWKTSFTQFPNLKSRKRGWGGECFKNKEYKQIKTLRRLTLKKLRNCSWKW